MSSSSVSARLEDLHSTFADKKVKAILTVIGGFNSNQLLSYLDYGLIKNNPKIFCGYSNITALQHAIYSETGLITYSGPHFSTFAMEQGFEYALVYFKKMFFEGNPIELIPFIQNNELNGGGLKYKATLFYKDVKLELQEVCMRVALYLRPLPFNASINVNGIIPFTLIKGVA
jgi:muramoyltetrapeptide carboxypeptidase LdcA involved in peptidoglycan recycling